MTDRKKLDPFGRPESDVPMGAAADGVITPLTVEQADALALDRDAEEDLEVEDDFSDIEG